MKAIADIWQAYRTRDRKAEADLEKSLAEALHGSPLSLAIGALTGTIISCTIASRSGDDALRLVAIGMALLAIGRLAGNYVAQRQAKGFGPADRKSVV